MSRILPRLFAPSLTAVIALTLLVKYPAGAEANYSPVTPTVAFSNDETIVRIEHEKGQWTLVRPVISPWKYAPAGRILWVDPQGDDGRDGTAQQPLLTFGQAMAQARAGDIVYVRPGTYVESLRITRSGEQDKPIILSCAPDALGRVKITPSRQYTEKYPSAAVITFHGARHVWINGLVIEGPRGRPEAPKQEMYGANGITWAGKAGLGCRATNNVVYGNVHCGLKEMGHGGTGILMEGNVIFENGTDSHDHGIYCPADDITIRGNIIFQNAGYGIHSYSKPQRQSITHNICFGNKAAGIILAGSDCTVRHNVCTYNGIGIFYYRGGCKSNRVENNIFAFNKKDCGYDNGGGKLGDPSSITDDYNCYFPGKPHPRIVPGVHEVLLDPQLMDSGKGDFRLKERSPCLGKGLNLGPPDENDASDLGAFSLKAGRR